MIVPHLVQRSKILVMVLFHLLIRRVLDKRALDRLAHHAGNGPAVREQSKIVGKDTAAVEERKGGAVGLFGKVVDLFDGSGGFFLLKEVVFAKGVDRLLSKSSRKKEMVRPIFNHLSFPGLNTHHKTGAVLEGKLDKSKPLAENKRRRARFLCEQVKR